MLLVFEMVVFMSLIVPMPFTWKRALFTFLAHNPIVAKIQYGMKVRITCVYTGQTYSMLIVSR